MFSKSGILTFIFAENNYSIYAHTMLIKTPLLPQSSGPPVLLSLPLPLSLLQADIPWFMQKANKAPGTGLALFIEASGTLSMR